MGEIFVLLKIYIQINKLLFSVDIVINVNKVSLYSYMLTNNYAVNTLSGWSILYFDHKIISFEK